jgi:DNA processing protein
MADGVGARTFAALLENFGTPQAILSANRAQLRAVKGIGPSKAKAIASAKALEEVEAEIKRAEACGVRIICRLDADYPEPLLRIPDAPICLYVQGEMERSDAVAVAVVGSRRGTQYGYEQARRFGYLLAQAGFTVVSGMARGIDSCAHSGAIEAGGRTIAVLGNGLSRTYPPESEPLRESILEHGAVVSESLMETEAHEGTFPSRNRIIAGLCLGTLVVEAGRRSGALITAELATDYNREVFAVPGRVDAPTSEGTNGLIRDGKAKLVSRLEDVLEEMGDVGRVLAETGESEGPVLDSVEEKVLAVLGAGEYHVEEIIRETRLTPAQVAGALTMLQLRALARQLPGNRYVSSRRPGA